MWGMVKVESTKSALLVYAKNELWRMQQAGTPGLSDAAALTVLSAIFAAPDDCDGLRLSVTWDDGPSAPCFRISVEGVQAVKEGA